MAIPYVEPFYVDPGFVDDEEGTPGGISPFPYASTPALEIGIHATDFREYRRGRYPGDWVSRWVNTGTEARVEGAHCDHHGRNVFQVLSSTVNGARCLHTWGVTDNDTGRGSIETVTLGRLAIAGSDTQSLRIHHRASGTGTAYNSYQVLVMSTSILLRKLVAGVATLLGTITKSTGYGSFVYVRFRSQGATHRVKVWQYGETEPATWDVFDGTEGATSITDATFSDGWHGVEGFWTDSTPEISFYSAATNGQTAPLEDYLPVPMDQWLVQSSLQLAMIARLEYYDPATDTVKEKWVGNLPMTTGPTDYPASVEIEPLLLLEGSAGTAISGDPIGDFQFSPGALSFHNIRRYNGDPGDLAVWRDYSFAGRPVEIRLGRYYATPSGAPPVSGPLLHTPLRHYEILNCFVSRDEIDVQGDRGTLQLSSDTRVLDERIPSTPNIGIATGVKTLTNTGYVSIPNHATYNSTSLLSFCVYVRAFVPTTGVPGAGNGWLSRRVTGSFYQWSLAFGYASHATVGNRLFVEVTAADNTQLFSYIYPVLLNDGAPHDVVLGVEDKSRWYLIVDGVKVMGATGLTKSVKTATGSVVELARVLPGITILDHRIERFVPEDEAIDRYLTRRDPDELNVSMHRGDDNTGATVTDYNTTTANHGTLQGVLNTDISWVPTYLGGPELTGNPMPMSGGVVYHAPAQQIDSARNIFRYTDARLKTVGASLEARDKGVVNVITTDYVEPADGPGTYDYVGAVSQPITFGLKPVVTSGVEDSRIQVARLLRDELLSRGIAGHAELNGDSLLALRQTLPVKGGYYYDQPPTMKEFLSYLLGGLGSGHYLDQDGRLSVSYVVPPINPGPYGHGSYLEFLGYPGRGVTVAAHVSYNLTGVFSITLAFKLHSPIMPDPSTSSTFTWHPTGQTLIDKTNDTPVGASPVAGGFYVGFDGRDGGLIFSTPGFTSGGGLHYRKVGKSRDWKVGKWYVVVANVNSNADRSLAVRTWNESASRVDDLGDVHPTADLACSGSVAATTAPLRIGWGPSGSFACGSIAYVYGNEPGQGVPALQGDPVTDGIINDLSHPDEFRNGATVEKFRIPLTDGEGDYVLEEIQSRYGRIEGCRWCPRAIFDYNLYAVSIPPTLRRVAPLGKSDVRYKRNYGPLTDADINVAVSVSDRIGLKRPVMTDPLTLQSILDKYYSARRMEIDTPLYNQVDAARVNEYLRNRFTATRMISALVGFYWGMARLTIGDEIRVVSPDLAEGNPGEAGESNGEGDIRAQRVLVATMSLQDLRTRIEGWG